MLKPKTLLRFIFIALNILTTLLMQYFHCSQFSSYNTFSSKVANFKPPTCICRLRSGWSRWNFAMNFGARKLRVLGLSCGIICMILRLAILIQYRSVTDKRTTTAYTVLSISSRGKNGSHDPYHRPFGLLSLEWCQSNFAMVCGTEKVHYYTAFFAWCLA